LRNIRRRSGNRSGRRELAEPVPFVTDLGAERRGGDSRQFGVEWHGASRPGGNYARDEAAPFRGLRRPIVRTAAPRKPEFAAAAVLLLSVVVVLTSHGHESENSRQGRSPRLPLGNGLYALDR
jgi:hypothetical protein